MSTSTIQFSRRRYYNVTSNATALMDKDLIS